jgi:hypothetical protein
MSWHKFAFIDAFDAVCNRAQPELRIRHCVAEPSSFRSIIVIRSVALAELSQAAPSTSIKLPSWQAKELERNSTQDSVAGGRCRG